MVLRRLRGILVAAGLGAVGYGLFTALVALATIGASPPGTRDGYLELLSATARSGALTGAALGAVLAIALSLAERGCTVDTLSERRVKAWGALAGLAAFAGQFTANYHFVPRGWSAWYLLLVGGPIIGGMVAAGYLALARRRRAVAEPS